MTVGITQSELNIIKSFKRVIIFFDSYNSAIDTISQFDDVQEVKFVVAVRSGIQDVRFHEIQAKLPSPLKRINLNELQKRDFIDFKRLLDKSGVRAPDLEKVIDNCHDIREVVLSLYDNKLIKDRIREAFSPLLTDERARRIFITIHILELVGQDVDAAFLKSVTDSDPYAEMNKFKEITSDFFRLDDDNLQVRSAMFSEYMVQNYFDHREVVECVYPLIVEAVKRKVERRYQAILSSLMRFSVLERALSGDPDYIRSLVGLFEHLRRDLGVNKEPLFWLQYSILMTAANDLHAAEGFIRTAYARAQESSGFQTFQIDTYALKLLLQIEQRSSESKVDRFDEIADKLERVNSMIGDENRRIHAIQVLEGIEPFVGARIAAFSTGERMRLSIGFHSWGKG